MVAVQATRTHASSGAAVSEAESMDQEQMQQKQGAAWGGNCWTVERDDVGCKSKRGSVWKNDEKGAVRCLKYGMLPLYFFFPFVFLAWGTNLSPTIFS